MNGENMQRRTGQDRAGLMRARRTQPALPGVTLPTDSIALRHQQDSALPQSLVSKKHHRHAQQAALKLIGLGLLLSLLYLAMYPLLSEVGNRPLNQAYYAKFPWLPHLFLTSWTSLLVQRLHLIPIFDRSSGVSPTTIVNEYPNLILALFVMAFVLALVASRVGTKVARERLTSNNRSLLFWVVCLFTAAFGVIFLFAPGVMSQDIFLYAMYGRMASIYNVNPCVVSPTAYTTDIFHVFLLDKGLGVAHYGPLWIDMTLPVVLIARASVANILFGFRLLGFIFYMANAMLIWVILTKLKPEMRISGVVLFAWNPLVLLTGVSEAHYEIVVITFLLLGALLFQRRSFLLSWVFLLLATLLNMFCLLLLPFFLKVVWKETRVMRGGWLFMWWLALTSLSAVVVVLSFAPFTRGLGLMGIVLNLEGTFLEENAVHSLDAAILYLPMGFPLFFSSWIFLGLTVLLPVHRPWIMLFPLALAIVSTSRYTILLAMLLTMGATLEYYFLLWPKLWPNLALVTICLPLLIWGWTLFFTATWLMARPKETEQQPTKSIQNFRFSRSSFPSRPSWPGQRKQI
jgi:hypothetical protein